MATPAGDVSIAATTLSLSVFVGGLVIILVLLWSWIKNKKSTDSDKRSTTRAANVGSAKGKNENQQRAKSKKKTAADQQQQQQQQQQQRRGRELKSMFSHPWLLTSLKGHGAKILDMDFSSNGKFLASCAEDRSIFVWNTKDFTEKEHKSVRANVEFDHAKRVKWSPDSKAFVICQSQHDTIEVFKLGKKNDGSLGNIQSVLTFPEKHEKEVIGIGISCTGKFIMSCSSDTTMLIWDLKGEILAVVDNHQMNTNCAVVSPCGRYVATSGFTTDVKVWEVRFTKSGDFKEVTKAFDLKGHSSGVYSFAFNNDSSRMATVSKDGTWKFWDTKVEYDLGQEPYLLLTGKYDHTGPSKVALSPDGRTIVIAAGSKLSFYSTLTGKDEGTIDEIHSDDIEAVIFDNTGKYVLTTGDRQIRVFHNVPGYKSTIHDLEEMRKKADGKSIKDRIQRQIDEAKESLKNILNN